MDQSPDTSPEEQPGGPAGLSPEDARRFFEQLRGAPAEQIVAEVFSTLLTAAEVKLGRPDARVFIDLCAAVVEPARAHVSAELAKQVDSTLGQLRLAQVSAESQAAAAGAETAEEAAPSEE